LQVLGKRQSRPVHLGEEGGSYKRRSFETPTVAEIKALKRLGRDDEAETLILRVK
jgi:hypothetical protein